MRVISMVLIDMAYWLISAISLGIAFLTKYWVGFAYINSLLILSLLYLAIVRIPLVLNWSRNLYGSVFTRIFLLQVFSIISYAISYKESQAIGGEFETFWDSVYFSATTWTTLGYGDFSPSGNIRLLTSIQALTGLSTLPVLASVIWLYCEKRLKSTSQDMLDKESFNVRLDDALGIFIEIDSEKTESEKLKRNKIKLRTCNCAEPSQLIVKYYDVIGLPTPMANFIVTCRNCGKTASARKNAYLAALAWNNTKDDR